MSWTIVTFYRFTRLTNPGQWRLTLQQLSQGLGLRGTILLAPEGINATLAGDALALDTLITWLQQWPGLESLKVQRFQGSSPPFDRLKIKVKPEIVSLGQPQVDPQQGAGIPVAPADWNRLIQDPEVLVLDSRNSFEVEMGSFAGAVNPQTRCFRELPAYLESHLASWRNRPIAMFCTGGIRCEKASAYLRRQGCQRVYQLQGGILSYLKQVPSQDSLWQGECFVFDQRVTVNHRLEPGQYHPCQTC
ncbi:MAG: rhodanese-related sulfurtransferase [Nodosilinea sp.]